MTSRSRMVARAFKDSNTNEKQCAPISSFASVGVLLALSILHNPSLMILDVKDTFLPVPQVEAMYVMIPKWIQALDG